MTGHLTLLGDAEEEDVVEGGTSPWWSWLCTEAWEDEEGGTRTGGGGNMMG